MRRIWLDKEFLASPEFELTGEAFKHAIVVCKFRTGEQFEIVWGEPFAWIVEIVSIQKKSARVRVLNHRSLPTLQPPFVNLAISVPKWSTLENIMEKSVELGVKSIQPIISDFSFIRNKKDFLPSRFERLQKIIKSATEQSGRGSLLEILDPLTLREFVNELNQKPNKMGLFAYEGAATADVRTQLENLNEPLPIEFWAIVGSEGGFSLQEQEFIERSGYPPVTLGRQILRSETACITLVSIIKYRLGLFK